MDALAKLGEPCPTCEHPMDDGRCGNPVCGWDTRSFTANSSVAARTGVLKTRINDYKYGGQTHWASIFGRVLAGYLEANAAEFREYDLIISSPVFVGPEGRSVDHIRAILEAAEAAAPGEWPFDLQDPPAIVRTRATDRFTGKSYQERRAARSALRDALSVPRPQRTAGRRIVVVDDVFTTGTTLDEVARALLARGRAREVVGLSLARQIRGQ
jgi:predicted amidophosphoribosyltransferase